MEVILAILIGVIYSTSLFLILRRSIVKMIIGLALFGHAANLLIITSGRVVKGRPPLIDTDPEVKYLTGVPAVDYADPIPGALVLTAIVIGFAILAFTAVLVKRAHQEIGTDDLEEMRSTDA